MHADPDDLGKGIMVKFGCKTVCLLHLGFHCSLVWFHNHLTYVIHLQVL